MPALGEVARRNRIGVRDRDDAQMWHAVQSRKMPVPGHETATNQAYADSRTVARAHNSLGRRSQRIHVSCGANRHQDVRVDEDLDMRCARQAEGHVYLHQASCTGDETDIAPGSSSPSTSSPSSRYSASALTLHTSYPRPSITLSVARSAVHIEWSWLL